MNAEEFLRALFAPAPKESRVLIRKGGNLSHYELAGDIPSFNANEEWFFGVLPRDSKGAIPLATTIWADVDHPSESYDLNAINPVPSVIVSSGGGYHVYWFLSEAIDSASAVRLAKLARIAVDGDKAVCEPARQLRIPGTLNAKYTPPRTVSILRETEVRYSERQLTQELIASVVVTVWEENSRHMLALALGAILARGGWGEDAAVQVVRRVCEITRDNEPSDRIQAVQRSIARRANGERVSAADLRDVLDKRDFQILLEAAGVTAQDGDIVYAGQVVGSNTEADLCRVIYDDPLWGRAGGGVVRRNDAVWEDVSEEDFQARVFDTLCSITSVKKGEEQPIPMSAARARSIASMARAHFPQLGDVDPNLLFLGNGALHLSSLELLPHVPENNNRWCLSIDYDPEAQAPRWKQYLMEVVNEEEAQFLQEWFAYFFVHGNPHQVMLWLVGPPGTGKSRIPLVLKEFFTTAFTEVDFADLASEYTRAAFSKAKIVSGSELSNRMLTTSHFKAIVAGDPISARNPYGLPFTFVYGGKIIITSNSTPPLSDSEGMARRIHPVQFHKVIANQDGDIIDKFRVELPGILNWALEALPRLRSYRKNEWPLPSASVKRINEFIRGADTLGAFITESLEFSSESIILDRQIFQAYKMWCEARGIRPQAFDSVFRYRLEKMGLTPVQDNPYDPGYSGAKLRGQIFDGRVI